MAVVDVSSKTITLKIVYYGCALGGKTTNLITLHRLTDPDRAQGLVSIATNDDRTLFFDLLPMALGQVGGMTVKVKLYTVPGQVHYELTRRQVLAGADGVVLVADSSPEAKQANQWALENVRFNMKKNGMDPDKTPILLQWNKRDLPNARPVGEMQADLNPRGLPTVEAVATTGAGVVETFADILKRTIVYTYVKHGRQVSEEQIGQTVDNALKRARSQEPQLGQRAEPVFDHRFDMDSYRENQAEQGHDRRVVDHESLLTESVNASMHLAEKLEGMRQVEGQSERRARMMEALARLTPMLADPTGDALPSGAIASLLQGCKRQQGSLLLLRPNQKVMEDREIVPSGQDPLNAIVPPGLGSVAYGLAQAGKVQIVENLAEELFFGDVPPGASALASVLVAPVACDGLSFGAVFVYSLPAEPAFDSTEREYWTTASTLVGLSLHWRALRRKVLAAKAS